MTDLNPADEASLKLSRQEHLRIAKTGAELSGKEKSALLSHLHDSMKNRPGSDPLMEQQRQSPIFFGAWSGINPFRHLKPFFLSRRERQ